MQINFLYDNIPLLLPNVQQHSVVLKLINANRTISVLKLLIYM